jgi:hypothetical protein
MVLAEITTEIASHSGYGIGTGCRINMKERFFFDGVNVFGNQRSVNKRVKDTVPIFSYTADTPSIRLNRTSVRAQVTAHLPTFKFFVKHCLFNHLFT